MPEEPEEPDRLAASVGGLKCLACQTPMGRADTCPACGWTYATANPEPVERAPAPAKPEPSVEPAVAMAGPTMSRRALWAEVAVVLAVEVIPRVVVPLTQPSPPAPPLLYGADTASLTITSACTVFVVLYLITRSGEPWNRFGVDRPGGWDIPLGIGMLFVSFAVSLFYFRLGFFTDDPETYLFPHPAGLAGLAMGVVKFGAAGFMEELVFRAYLITRLETLFRSSWRALVVAALLFALVHGYQGPAGVWYTFLFGLAYGGVYLAARRVWPLAIGHALTNLVLDYAR